MLIGGWKKKMKEEKSRQTRWWPKYRVTKDKKKMLCSLEHIEEGHGWGDDFEEQVDEIRRPLHSSRDLRFYCIWRSRFLWSLVIIFMEDDLTWDACFSSPFFVSFLFFFWMFKRLKATSDNGFAETLTHLSHTRKVLGSNGWTWINS